MERRFRGLDTRDDHRRTHPARDGLTTFLLASDPSATSTETEDGAQYTDGRPVLHAVLENPFPPTTMVASGAIGVKNSTALCRDPTVRPRTPESLRHVEQPVPRPFAATRRPERLAGALLGVAASTRSATGVHGSARVFRRIRSAWLASFRPRPLGRNCSPPERSPSTSRSSPGCRVDSHTGANSDH